MVQMMIEIIFLTKIKFKPWLDLNFFYNYGDNVTLILYSHQTSGRFVKMQIYEPERGEVYNSGTYIVALFEPL